MRAFEVCAGIGGLSLALEMAGFETAGLCEFDPRCRAHLMEKWPDVPVFADMRALSGDDLRRLGRVDLLAGGIPCQPWSVAGKRDGSEDERDLWPDFLDLGLRLGAKALLVENVAGLASDPRGLDRIAGDLERSGYAWWACSLRAADVGAPHLRDRLFVCAVADDYRAGFGRRASPAVERRDVFGDETAGPHVDGCHQPDRLADAGSAGPQGRRRAAADLQRPAAERGGEVGDAQGWRRPEGRPEPVGQQGRSDAALASPWSDARPILCRDGKARLVPTEPALFPVAHGSPGRVARLRAVGNAVVPLQAYVPARALYQAMTEIAA